MLRDSGFYLAEAANLLERGRQQGNRVEGMHALARLAVAHMELADRLAEREAAGLQPPETVHPQIVLDCHDRHWVLGEGKLYRLATSVSGSTAYVPADAPGQPPAVLATLFGPLRTVKQ